MNCICELRVGRHRSFSGAQPSGIVGMFGFLPQPCQRWCSSSHAASGMRDAALLYRSTFCGLSKTLSGRFGLPSSSSSLQQQLHTAEIQLKLAAAAIVAVVAGPAASAAIAAAAELSCMSCCDGLASACCCRVASRSTRSTSTTNGQYRDR